MKKKFIIFIVCLILLPSIYLFSGCNSNNNLKFRINDEYLQWSDNGKLWEDIISIEELKGDAGKDVSYEIYTVTYDYGTSKALFDNAKDSIAIKSTEWLIDIPTIKDEYKDTFLGWYIEDNGIDKQVSKYDFIGGNVILYAKFDV